MLEKCLGNIFFCKMTAVSRGCIPAPQHGKKWRHAVAASACHFVSETVHRDINLISFPASQSAFRKARH